LAIWLPILAAPIRPAAAPSETTAGKVAEKAAFSLSVGSFGMVNNIVPRVELDTRDLLSVGVSNDGVESQARFPADAQDVQNWIGTEAFLFMPR
jgi:hypothetical protein